MASPEESIFRTPSNWDPDNEQRVARLDHYRNRIFVGMKIAGRPAVNWNKLRKAQQDPEENPSALHRGKENTFKNVLPGVRSGKQGE